MYHLLDVCTFSTWDTTLATWLYCNVISHVGAHYISHLRSVYGLRPHDPNDDARSDEDVSDEELVLTEADLENKH